MEIMFYSIRVKTEVSEPKNSVGVITYVKAKGCFLIDLYRAGSVFTDTSIGPTGY